MNEKFFARSPRNDTVMTLRLNAAQYCRLLELGENLGYPDTISMLNNVLGVVEDIVKDGGGATMRNLVAPDPKTKPLTELAL